MQDFLTVIFLQLQACRRDRRNSIAPKVSQLEALIRQQQQ